jgi:predicted transcriptional regulator
MAMTLRLSDDEARALRAQADIEGCSMQEVARAAVREYVQRRSAAAQVDEALHVLIPRYAGLLERLGNA